MDIPLPGVAGSELSAFLSLVTALLEKIPLTLPGQIERPSSSPSDATSAAPLSKDKDTKNDKKEESLVRTAPARLVPEPVAFLAKPAVAFGFPTPVPDLVYVSEQVTSGEKRNDGGSLQDAGIASKPLVPAPAAMTPAAGELAFALRLTPNGLETMNFAAGPRLEPVHTQSRPGSDSGSPATSSLLRAVTSETPAPEFPALKEPIADSAQFRVETPPNPFQASPNLFQNDERSPSASPGAQLKSAPRVVAAVGSLDSLAHQPQAEAKSNNTLRVIPPSLPRPNPAVESGISQSQPNGSKPEPAAKPELPETHLNGGRVEGSSAQAVPGWPSDAAGAPDTRVGPPAVSQLPALKVAPEPEIKAAIAPPPTRQISLKLRTDDSTRVNVDVTERAGKVLVAVRTSDHELAQSLQTDLGDLVGRLETKGFKTEAWMPAVALPAAAPSPSSNANPNFAQPQNSNPGNGSGQRRQGQNGPDQRPKTRWAAQLQETMSAKQARSESE